jgi:CheY-like chemotaxis protein
MVFFIKTMRATPEEERTAALDASALSHRSSRSTLAAAPGLKPCSPTPSQSIRFEAPRPTVSASVVQKYHILLVEDNLINQQVLSKQLRRAGCAVEISNHGDEALNFIKTTRYWHENNGLGHEISFILMDWEMPIRDGISATKEIRSLEKDGLITKHLTIIATTANVRTEQVKVAMDAGMVSFKWDLIAISHGY